MIAKLGSPLIAVLTCSAAFAKQGPVRVSPEIVNRDTAAALRVGERLTGLSFIDATGKTRKMDRIKPKVVVLAIRDIDCPVSKRYAPRLASIQKAYAGNRDVSFVYVFPDDLYSVEQMRKNMADHGHRGLLARDPDRRLARQLQLRTTAEVFVLDKAHTLRYRGAIDDQYGIGYIKDAPAANYLKDAIDTVLSGGEVAVKATTAPGCEIETKKITPPENAKITYHNRISRIIQNNCQVCHRKGGAGPFSLETYAQVKAKRKMIRYVVEDGIMPPWFAKHEPGKWLNDRSLSTRDKTDLLSWIKDGCAVGNPKDAPLPVQWSNDWVIGEPDLVVKMPKPFKVPAEGEVAYQHVIVENPLDEDRWVKAMELKPSAPEVVHHILVFQGADIGAAGGLKGYFTGLVPGQGTTIYTEEFGKRLKARSKLIFQLHYTTNGKSVSDQTELGFVFHDKKPKHEVHTLSAATTKFAIPPGAENHKIVAEYPVLIPGKIMSFAPHTHLRGKSFRYDLVLPGGKTQELIDIPHYDFNWQLRYKLAEPIFAPFGSKIRATAWYDNSEKNPANPDPKATVRHGDQTWDEMMIGYFEAYADR